MAENNSISRLHTTQQHGLHNARYNCSRFYSHRRRLSLPLSHSLGSVLARAIIDAHAHVAGALHVSFVYVLRWTSYGRTAPQRYTFSVRTGGVGVGGEWVDKMHRRSRVVCSCLEVELASRYGRHLHRNWGELDSSTFIPNEPNEQARVNRNRMSR